MGQVWSAQRTSPVQRQVAVKRIKPGSDSKAVVARFEAERQAFSVMDHLNIAQILDGDLTDERDYRLPRQDASVVMSKFDAPPKPL